MKQPDACIVRITNAQGETQGTGFLVSTDGLIVTCAHVVEETEPCVAFPGGEPRPAQVVATDQAHDVAILQLQGELPDRAKPARLGCSTEAYHRDFWSRGYRPLGEMEGIPAEGRVLHAVSECQGVDYMPLILKSQDIRKGMSGAPVYIPDWDLVVGMITGYWDSLKAGTGFADRDTALAIPVETIVALWPDIRLWEPPPELKRPPLGVPFQAPPIPRYFVPRPEVSNDLKTRLLADEVPAPGALVVSAVHGLGGIGKTTLVAALAHDSELQTRFPDGILWATLGHEPEVLSLLVGWVQALGDYNFRPTVVESATNHLRTFLHDKACLLVVDDTWQADHVRPFLVGGPRCRVLVTTRDAVLARKVGARLYDLDVMTEAQALALFEARLGPLDGYRGQAVALARELGYLPLALELATAQVEAGYSWDELLDAFRRELTDLAALDLDEATYRNESLRLSFRFSLDRLSDDDRDAFIWLGVLLEDVVLNPATAATLWDEAEAEARKRLRHLRDKALLREMGTDQYSVHDLLHDEARLRLEKQMSLPQAHARLLDRYRRKVTYGGWDRLPDDGYVHEHLSWHMEQAGQPEAIHALLRLETPEGHNVWYEAREALGQTAGYQDDVRRAWRLAEEDFASRSSPFAIGLQCRYVLIIASLNSLAKNVPPALLVALVEKSVWPPAQGLAHAQQMPNPGQRGETLAGLAPHLPESLLQEALMAARAIKDESARWEALAGLLPHLPEPLLWEVLMAAREIEDESARCKVLVGLTPHLTNPGHAQEALAAAREIRDARYRSIALAGLAPDMPEPESLLQEVLTAIWESKDEPWQVCMWQVHMLVQLSLSLPKPKQENILCEALIATRSLPTERGFIGESPRVIGLTYLAPYLPESLLQQALAMVQVIEDGGCQAEALDGLAPHLSEELLQEALAAARDLPDERDPYRMNPQAFALARLVPRLAELGYPQRALTVAQDIEDGVYQADALAKLAPYLSEDLLQEALAAARDLPDEQDAYGTNPQGRALARLIPRLAELGHPQRALAMARGIEDEVYQAEALVGLAPYLLEGLLQEALAAARDLPDEQDMYGRTPQRRALARLVPRLAELGHPQRALAMVREFEWLQTSALAQLAPHLPEGLLHEALTAVRDIEEAGQRAKTLAGLAPYLSEALLREALTTVYVIQDSENQVRALNELASPRLAELGYPREALAAAQEVEDSELRAQVLAGLVPYLSEELLHEALAAAWEVEDERGRARVLAKLSHRLAELGHPQKALALAQEIEDVLSQARVLAELAPYLSEGLLKEALVMARQLPTSQDSTGRIPRACALAPLALRLVELGHPQEALTIAGEIKDKQWRAEVLDKPVLPPSENRRLEESRMLSLAAHGIETQAGVLYALTLRLAELGHLQEAIAAAHEIVYERWQAHTLGKLALKLAELGHTRMALAMAREIRVEAPRAEALAKLAPYLPEVLLEEALTAVREIDDEIFRAMAFDIMAPHLPEGLVRAALAIAREFESDQDRAHVLAELAVRLGELNFLDMALAVACEIEDKQRRAAELVRLAPRLPEGLLQQTLMIVREAKDGRWQTDALVKLAHRLVDLNRPHDALATVQEIRDATDRAPALADLSDRLAKQGYPQEALLAAREIEDEKTRARVLLGLSPHLTERLLQEVLVAAQGIGDSRWQAHALTELSHRLADLGHPQQALVLVQEINDVASRIQALTYPALNLSKLLQSEALHAAIAATRDVSSANKRAQALVPLISYLPEALVDALAAVREIEHTGERAQVLDKLAPYLVQASRGDLYSHWWGMLPRLAHRTRQDMFADVCALAPVIAALGGEEAIAETCRAIQDVGRWWP